MFDWKYLLIRSLQFIVLTYNFFIKLITKNNFKILGNEKILIVKLDRLGDAVWGVELAKLIKKNFPKVKIDILCNNYNFFVFEENKNIFNKIIKINCLPPSYTIKNFFNFLQLFKDFIECKTKIKNIPNYDILIDTTSKKLTFFRKKLGKQIITPIGHKEIGNKNFLHGIPKLLNLKTYKIYNFSKIVPTYSGIVFLGGKSPNKLDNLTYKKIIKTFQDLGIKITTLSDDHKIQADYYLSLSDTFYINDIPFNKFLKNYDFFLSADGGVFHYASQYITGIGFYTSTNLLSIDKVKKIFQIGNRKIFESQFKNNLYITKLLPCTGCFQIGCKNKKCSNIIDNELKIIIKKIKNFLYE